MSSDNFATATEVVIATNGGTYTQTPVVDNSLYTEEVDEPDNGGSSNKSAWWKYTPASSGTATFDTQQTTPNGSHTDTVMAIYTGTALNNLVLVASNDDGGGSGTSLISSQAVTGGTTYYIQVGAFGTANMNYGFRVTGQATSGGGGGTDGNVIAVPATATGEALPPVITGESIVEGGGPATATAQAHAPNVSGGATGDGQVSAVTATATAQAHSPTVSDGQPTVTPPSTESRQDNAVRRLRTQGYSGSLQDMQRAWLLDEYGGTVRLSVADLQLQFAALDRVYEVLPDDILPVDA